MTLRQTGLITTILNGLNITETNSWPAKHKRHAHHCGASPAPGCCSIPLPRTELPIAHQKVEFSCTEYPAPYLVHGKIASPFFQLPEPNTLPRR